MKFALAYTVLNKLAAAYKSIFYPILTKYNTMYERRLQSRLRVHNFSIISADCAGGIISHRLGEQFHSPTVNLWMSHTDCVKLITNLRHYLSFEPVYIKTSHTHPVAMIDDLTIYFNHYKDEATATEKWNERKKRVNYDKLYLIITAGDDLTDEQLKQIDELKIANKVVITRTPRPEYDFVKVIKPHVHRVDGDHCMDRNLLLKWTFETKFDFVQWLNEGNVKL